MTTNDRIRAAQRALNHQERRVGNLRVQLAMAETILAELEQELDAALAAPSMTDLGAHVFDLGCKLNQIGVARW